MSHSAFWCLVINLLNFFFLFVILWLLELQLLHRPWADDGLLLPPPEPLYHAGLLSPWCRLSRVPLTHLGPYLPPSRSLEKWVGGNLLQRLSLDSHSHPGFWFSYAVESPWLLLLCPFFFNFFFADQSLSPPLTSVWIKVWANSVAACHDRKQQSRYNPYLSRTSEGTLRSRTSHAGGGKKSFHGVGDKGEIQVMLP